jgi:hypothetical protein
MSDATPRHSEATPAESTGASTPGAVGPSDESGDATATRPRRPRRGRTIAIVAGALVVAAAIVVTVVVVQPDDEPAGAPVAATLPVALPAADLPEGTTVGVIVTLGPGAEGADWNGAAQGALVAERRLELGGADIALATENDGGTEAGAADAVAALVERGVAGIVVASSGPHIVGALSAAADAGLPVVLPYAPVPDGAEGSVWSTAPDTASTGAALTEALAGATRTLLVDAGGGAPVGVEIGRTLAATSAAGDDGLAREVARLTGSTPPATETGDDVSATASQEDEPVADPSDAVLVSGSAARLADVVALLQTADLAVPVVLTADATSPAFSSGLTADGASLSGSLVTVGPETGDATALRGDGAGRSVSAFLGGVRVLAQDPDAVNLTDDQPFAAVAGAADARSHDAVIALVRAVEASGSIEPGAVGDALGDLALGASAGIAGPELDFSSAQALGGEVTVLNASSQDLGLRPTADDGSTSLIWFAGPATTPAAG